MKFTSSTTIAITLISGSLLSVTARNIPTHASRIPRISAETIERAGRFAHRTGQIIDIADRVTQQQQESARGGLESGSSLPDKDLERRGLGGLAAGIIKLGVNEVEEVAHVAEGLFGQHQPQKSKGKSRRALEYGVSEDLTGRGWDEEYD